MIAELFSNLDWRTFLFAMLVVELTPGPNMGWLAALSAQHGWRVGFVAVAGVTLGLAVQVIAAATGLSTLISSFPVVYESIRWAGVLFMLWLAWEAFSDVGIASPANGLSAKGFRRGLVANLLNPKALLFYVVVIGQFIIPSAGPIWWQIIILGSMHLCIAVVVHLAIVMLGARVGDRFERWRTSLTARLVFALSLVGIAIWIAVSTS